jgi:hypothetical protein
LHFLENHLHGFRSQKIIFAIFKMCAIFTSFWVRRLIGKPGVPYNRRLRVRGSPHPHDYDADLSLAAAESNAFRIQADLASLALKRPTGVGSSQQLQLMDSSRLGLG